MTWICLAYILISARQNSKLLRGYLLQLPDALENELTKAAFEATKDSMGFVKNCWSKRVSKMFAYVSREVKAYMSIQNNSLHSLSDSPTKHLLAQTESWRARWHPTNSPELINVLNGLLFKLRHLSLSSQHTLRAFDVPALNGSLLGDAISTAYKSGFSLSLQESSPTNTESN